MGNFGLGQLLIDGQLGGHDHVIGGGKDSIHTTGHQSGSSGDHLVIGVARLFHIGDSLAVQVLLGLLDGSGGVGLGQRVQQPHLLHVGILGEHHIQNDAGLQGVAGAGDVVQPGELCGLGVRYCGVHHRGLGVLGTQGHHLSGGAGDGNDGVHPVYNSLVSQLLEHGLVVLSGIHLIFNGYILFLGNGVQLSGDCFGDLIQRGMVHLLDHSHLVGVVLPILACTTGTQREKHGARYGTSGKSTDDLIVFHGVFLHFLNLGGRCFSALPGPKNEKSLCPTWDKSSASAIPPKLTPNDAHSLTHTIICAPSDNGWGTRQSLLGRPFGLPSEVHSPSCSPPRSHRPGLSEGSPHWILLSVNGLLY